MTSPTQEKSNFVKIPLQVIANSCFPFLPDEDLRRIARTSKLFLDAVVLHHADPTPIEETRYGLLDIRLHPLLDKTTCFRTKYGLFQPAAFSPDMRRCVSGSITDTIEIWDEKRRLVTTLNGHKKRVSSVAFSPDGEQFVSGSEDHRIKLWTKTGELIQTLRGHTKTVSSLAFSPNGERIVSGSDDMTVKVWNLKTNRVMTLQRHTGVITSVAFSPDGKSIISASEDRTVKVSGTNGALLHTLRGHTDVVVSVAVSSDGKIISGSHDETIKIWDTNNKSVVTIDHSKVQPCHFYPWRGGEVISLAISPNGKWIVSTNLGNIIKLWKTKGKGELVAMLDGDKHCLSSLAFSPEGSSIIATYHNSTTQFWNIPTIEDQISNLILNKECRVSASMKETIETQGPKRYLQEHAIWETRMFIGHYLRIQAPSLLPPYINYRLRRIRETFPRPINFSTRNEILSLLEKLKLSDSEKTQSEEINLIQTERGRRKATAVAIAVALPLIGIISSFFDRRSSI